MNPPTSVKSAIGIHYSKKRKLIKPDSKKGEIFLEDFTVFVESDKYVRFWGKFSEVNRDDRKEYFEENFYVELPRRNFLHYGVRSFPLVCEVNVKNDRKKSFSVLFRIHLKTYNINEHLEFKLRRGLARKLDGEFFENIRFEFRRRYPTHQLFLILTRNADGEELDPIELLKYLITLPHEDAKILLEGKCFPIKKANTITNIQFSVYFSSKLYYKIPSRLQNCDIRTKIERIIAMFHKNGSSKRFVEQSEKLLLFLERKYVGSMVTPEAYRILSEREKEHLQKQMKEMHSKNKSKSNNYSLEDLGIKTVTTNSFVNELWKKIKKREKGKEEGVGLTSSLFYEFYGRMINQALIDEDYERAFRYVIRGSVVSWNKSEDLLAARSYSSLFSYYIQIKGEEEEWKRKNRKGYEKCSKRGQLQSKHIGELLDMVNHESSLQDLLKTAKDLMIPKADFQSFLNATNIPFVIEFVFTLIKLSESDLKLFVNQDEKVTGDAAFDIVSDLLFRRKCNSTWSNCEFDYNIYSPFKRLISFANPFNVNVEEEKRTYDILVNHILRNRFDRFVEYVKNNKNEEVIDFEKLQKKIGKGGQENIQDRLDKLKDTLDRKLSKITSGDAFFSIGIFLRTRGEFDLSLKYINLAKSEDLKRLAYSYAKFHILMGQGLYEKAQEEARWIFLIAKRSRKDISKFIDCDFVLDLLSKKKKKSESTTTKTTNYYYRIPCFFKKDIWIVVGQQHEEASYFSLPTSSSPTYLLDKYCKRSLREVKIRRRKPLVRKRNSGILKVLYNLPVISFLQKDFGTLRKWILLLSKFEVCQKSYAFAKDHHLLYQIVANSYYLNFLSKKLDFLLYPSESVLRRTIVNDFIVSVKQNEELTNNNNEEEDQNIIKRKSMYLVGGEDIIPWSFLQFDTSANDDDEGKQCIFELVPVYTKELKCSDLLGLGSKNSLKRKSYLMDNLQTHIPHEEDIHAIFMLGEADLRHRILNTVPSDDLHYRLSEDRQVEILAEQLLKFSKICKVKYAWKWVGICPVFPFLNAVEEIRIVNEKDKHDGVPICGNRVSIFNEFLRKKLTSEDSENNHKKDINFLDGLDRVVLDADNLNFMNQYDLGCAAYIFPNGKLIETFEGVLKEKIMM